MRGQWPGPAHTRRERRTQACTQEVGSKGPLGGCPPGEQGHWYVHHNRKNSPEHVGPATRRSGFGLLHGNLIATKYVIPVCFLICKTGMPVRTPTSWHNFESQMTGGNARRCLAHREARCQLPTTVITITSAHYLIGTQTPVPTSCAIPGKLPCVLCASIFSR